MFNDTLTDYIRVAQDLPQIEHYVRQDDNNWKVFTYIGLDEICSVESIECKLKRAEVYDRIEFSEESLTFLRELEELK